MPPSVVIASQAPIGASTTRDSQALAEQARGGVDVLDIAADARAQRERIDRDAVSPRGRLGLGGTGDVVPDVGLKLGPRRVDDRMGRQRGLKPVGHAAIVAAVGWASHLRLLS